jgi:hypothetical protein
MFLQNASPFLKKVGLIFAAPVNRKIPTGDDPMGIWCAVQDSNL